MGFQIKKLIEFGFVGGMVLKKFGNMLLNMPRHMLRTAFKIQKKVVYFPLRLINTFYRLIFKQSITCNCTETQGISNVESSKIESPCNKPVLQIIELEPVSPCHKYVQANSDLELDSPSHKSIKVMLGLRQESPRRSAKTNQCLQPKLIKTVESVNKDNIKKDIEDDNFVLPEFPNAKSADFIRCSEIVTRKSLKRIDELSNFGKSCMSPDGEPSISKFSPCKKNFVPESNLNGIDCLFKLSDKNSVEITKSVKCMQHKEKLSKVYNSSTKSILAEAVPNIKVIRELDCQEKGSDIRNLFQTFKHAKNNRSFQIISSKEASGAESTLHNTQQVLNLSFEVLRSLVDIVTQEIISLKHRIVSTNSKIEEVLKSSFILFEELSKINERFNSLINLSNKITDLQHELGEGHKLFQEVEADRNDMQLKLEALERMIKEEEEYLGDVSYESGYDEVEIPATFPYKNGYL